MIQLNATTVFQSPVLPVIVIHDLNDALPLAHALIEGGITSLEVTLRSPVALQAIEKIRHSFPEALVGAGTAIKPQDYDDCINAGAKFVISPGASEDFLQHCQTGQIPFIPGTATPSEIITALEYGYDHLKFFPAEACGGTKTLAAVASVFPQIKFCPTGGINPNNVADYLKLQCVATVGGSWMLPHNAIKAKDWKQITQLSLQAIKLIKAVRA